MPTEGFGIWLLWELGDWESGRDQRRRTEKR